MGWCAGVWRVGGCASVRGGVLGVKGLLVLLGMLMVVKVVRDVL